MKTELTLEIIESYGFSKRTYKPDWDDTSNEYTLPNGILLETMTQCNNEPCKSDSLEGMEGYIYLDTKEDLDEFLSKSYDTICRELAEKYEDFDLDEWI